MSSLGKNILVGMLTAIAALSVGVRLAHPAAAQSQAPGQVMKRILVLYDEDKDNFPGLATIDRSRASHSNPSLGKPSRFTASRWGSHARNGPATTRS